MKILENIIKSTLSNLNPDMFKGGHSTERYHLFSDPKDEDYPGLNKIEKKEIKSHLQSLFEAAINLRYANLTLGHIGELSQGNYELFYDNYESSLRVIGERIGLLLIEYIFQVHIDASEFYKESIDDIAEDIFKRKNL